MSNFKIGDFVRRKRGQWKGEIVRDLGVKKPTPSNAPLAEHWAPEQCWLVRFELGKNMAGEWIVDFQGCWDSDIEPYQQENKDAFANS